MKILGLDYSGSVCAWSCIEDGKLTSYGSFAFDDIKCIPAKKEGAILNRIYYTTFELIVKVMPDYILLEDIFAQSVIGYKKLAKVQGAVEMCLAKYDVDIPLIMKCASEVRAPYHLSLYKPEFIRQLDERSLISRKFRERVASLKKPKRVKLSWYRKAYKFVLKYLKNYIATEFDIAKKEKVITFINNTYKLSLDYSDNDIADSILLAHYLYQLKSGIIKESIKKPKKKKVKKVVDNIV